jgi:hypothetical protein
MAFAEFLKTKNVGQSQLEESTETKANDKESILNELTSLYKQIDSKLNVIPVKYKNYFITVGVANFEIDDIPSISIDYDEHDADLDVRLGSSKVTKKSLKLYNKMMSELIDNYEYILDVLKKQSELHIKLRQTK